MAIGGHTNEVVTKWVLDAANAKAEIRDLAKEIRTETRHERNLKLVREKLEQQTNKNVSAMKRMRTAVAGAGKSMMGAVVGGNLLTSAIGALKNELVDVVQRSREYSQVSQAFVGNMAAMKTATSGLVSELDLMKSANQFHVLGVKLTGEEQEKLLKQLDKISAAMGTTLKYSIESATTALARQSALRADNIGVVLKAEEAQKKWADANDRSVRSMTESEKRLAFQVEFMDQLAEKAGKLPERIKTSSDTMASAWNTGKDAVVRFASAIDQVLGRALQNDARRVDAWRRGYERAFGFLAKVQKTLGTGIPTFELLKASALIEKRNEANLVILHRLSNIFQETTNALPSGAAATTAGKRKRSTRKRSTPIGAPAGSLDARAAMGEFTQGLGDPAEIARQMTEGARESAAAINEQTKAEEKNVAFKSYIDSLDAKISAHQALRDQIAATNDEMRNMAVTGLAQMAGGMWSVADAAIQGSESFGAAMAKMVKSTLMGIAQQSTIKAVFEAAEGFAALATWRFDQATNHFTAAGLYAAVAGVSGAAGLAMSAAGVGSGAASSGASGATRSKSAYSPSFGSTVTRKQQPINISLYIGDKGDPGAALLMTKQITAQLAKAA